MESVSRRDGDSDGQKGQTLVTDDSRPQLDPADPRLQKALERAKAARRALLDGGMSAGCSCNLCLASRLLLSVFCALGAVESELIKEKDKPTENVR